jgi:hypothetical protein
MRPKIPVWPYDKEIDVLNLHLRPLLKKVEVDSFRIWVHHVAA